MYSLSMDQYKQSQYSQQYIFQLWVVVHNDRDHPNVRQESTIKKGWIHVSNITIIYLFPHNRLLGREVSRKSHDSNK